ncbi:DUF1206 domain-containing protein [Streptomyces sp. NPDC057271]|uniref:DUF1206 domain-containing protein n=2 Tax=unclassified Streptomyces TaxID=2593676 RepID=UPI0036409CF2
MAGSAVMHRYRNHLTWGQISREARRFTDVTGMVGGVARGCVFAAVGWFGAKAAVVLDPAEAKGMDDAIRSFARTPAGPWLLMAVAVGLVPVRPLLIRSGEVEEGLTRRGERDRRHGA